MDGVFAVITGLLLPILLPVLTMRSFAEERSDGTLELTHDNSVDGRGLDLERSRRVLDYVQRVWRRPIVLTTVNQAGSTLELTAP